MSINISKAAALFHGWDEALIWSCLQGHMGNMLLDHDENPASAVIDIGDFCFFAGEPNAGCSGRFKAADPERPALGEADRGFLWRQGE